MDKGSQEDVTQQYISKRKAIQGIHVLLNESNAFRS